VSDGLLKHYINTRLLSYSNRISITRKSQIG
jgi:hypothetical protein